MYKMSQNPCLISYNNLYETIWQGTLLPVSFYLVSVKGKIGDCFQGCQNISQALRGEISAKQTCRYIWHTYRLRNSVKAALLKKGISFPFIYIFPIFFNALTCIYQINLGSGPYLTPLGAAVMCLLTLFISYSERVSKLAH